ncbi:MAG TPA: hypothetical protein VKA97_09390, partial [Pyrinomonadaceae bacterium]|nr:hypothetical protein [Pyrinomonadaceae bacterium]
MSRKVTRNLAFAFCAIVLCATVTRAQDAGQVLRVSVGFGTLKNTNKDKMPPEKLAEVERLEGLARKANAEGKYGDALKHMYHGMAVMRGMDWTPERALASALTLKLDHIMLEPGQPVEVKMGQIYALDEKLKVKLDGTIALLKMTGDQPVKELKAISNIEPDFITQPFAAQITVPD